MCRKDERKEAKEHDEYAVGTFIQESSKLVGHVPIELSFLVFTFLRVHEDNQVVVEVTGSRKREPALNNCFGFLDGTVRSICRPGEHQRVVYNGHKRVYALKLQSIDLPNGLIANMYGPVGEYICFSSILFLKGRTPLFVQKNAVHIWDNWSENHIFAHHFL